ncbi:MAG: hypothetical protein ABSB09_10745 [Acidimicrobiales bacterium]|jgi:hypothetical protein
MVDTLDDGADDAMWSGGVPNDGAWASGGGPTVAGGAAVDEATEWPVGAGTRTPDNAVGGAT